MSNQRCLLHKTKLEAFKTWLTESGIAFREGKGNYQVIQVQTPDHGFQVIFEKLDSPEHYSINEKLIPVVRDFIAAEKAKDKPAVPVVAATHSELSGEDVLRRDLATAIETLSLFITAAETGCPISPGLIHAGVVIRNQLIADFQ